MHESMYEHSEGHAGALQTLKSGLLAKNEKDAPETVGDLVDALCEMYPPKDAEPWDRTGLLAGDPKAPLKGVAVALDPTLNAVREAAQLGANVLLTHHPVFLDPPTSVRPVGCGGPMSGAVVYEAVRCGVSLVNFHTTLDVSLPAQEMLPGMLRLLRTGTLEPLATDETRGYGQICIAPADDGPVTLADLAARCTAVFGRPPRMWGDPDRVLQMVVTWTGGAGGAAEECLAQGIDALVCGEIKYHAALDAAAAGLCILDLGHDVSERPFASVLAESAAQAGVPREDIFLVDGEDAWMHPEARRA